MKFESNRLPIELAQLIKVANLVATGGEGKLAVKNGWVKLNGEVCMMAGKKVNAGDTVDFDGKIIEVSAK